MSDHLFIAVPCCCQYCCGPLQVGFHSSYTCSAALKQFVVQCLYLSSVLGMLSQVCLLVFLQLGLQVCYLFLAVLDLALQLTYGSFSNIAQLQSVA